MIRIAYIVSAYKLPAQLGRLLHRLAAPGASFAVHVDRKTPRPVYEEMTTASSGLDVTFLPRHVCHWGGFGHVLATLKGIDHFVRSGVEFDYAVLLTGQDYPLRPPAEIDAFLAAADGRSYMSHWALPHAPWGPDGGLERVERWHAITYGRRQLSVRRRRKLPLGLRPFGGSPYWCLARPAVDYVQTFVTENPEFVRFFRHVFIPDELMFQTILLNSPLRDAVVDDNVRYIDWTREPAPTVLERADLPAVLASHALFARKFDESVDATVLDDLDAYLDGRARLE